MRVLIEETAARAEECREYTVLSVFIGGGTPSVVPEEWIVRLLNTIKTHYRMDAEAELTIEVNPGTVTADKLRAYREAGINRLSIGLQSGSNEELKALGRIHTYEQFAKTYEAAVKAEFSNINVDVMSALPGQSPESYERTLEKVLALYPAPVHISAYSLIVEEGTLFAERNARGELALPDEETERRMYERTKEILGAAGFVRYEISNYAKPGFACRHNCGYWKRRDYLGFGIGAASLFQGKRFSNGRELDRYLKYGARGLCVEDVHTLTRREQMEEVCFLGLRMMEGVSFRAFLEEFGENPEDVYGEVIEKNKEAGLLYERVERETGERFLALTDRGIDVSNYVMAQFLLD